MIHIKSKYHFFIFFFRKCDLKPSCDDEVLSICQMVKKMSNEEDTAAETTTALALVTDQADKDQSVITATVQTVEDYLYESFLQNETLSVVDGDEKPSFSILGYDKQESFIIIVCISAVVIIFACLIIFALVRFKKIKCRIERRSVDFELQKVDNQEQETAC